MEFYVSNFVTVGLIFVLTLLTFRFYWNFKKKCSGFPLFHFVPYLIYCNITGKVPKNASFNSVAFQMMIEFGKKYMKEGVFMTYTTRPVLFLLNGKAIKTFASEKAAAEKPPEYSSIKDFLGDGILTSNGEKWKSHRKMINPAFHMSVLKEKISLFNEHAMALVKDMENLVDKPSVCILENLKSHYYASLSESVLGLKRNKENEAKFLKLNGYADNLADFTIIKMIYPWLRLKLVLQLLPSGRKYIQELKETDDYLTEIISEMKKHVYLDKNVDTEFNGNHLRKSLTYILLSRHLNDPSFTCQDVRDEVKTIISAGHGTITYSSLWCLFLLGLHPDIQEKAFNEVLSTTSDCITYEECSNLIYLESVVMETLRMYPGLPIYARNLSEDVVYGKYNVKKNTTIAFFPYVAYRDPEVYPDPDKFKPERFLNEDLRKSYNFMPFSEGSRNCIGKNYALIEMKIFLAHILRNFQITSLDRIEDIGICWSIIIQPGNPIHFKITRRECSPS